MDRHPCAERPEPVPARMLTVSHDASLSGAPVMLLQFLRWIREHRPGQVDLEVLLLRGGPLEPEFSALAPVRALAPFGRHTAGEVAYRHASRVVPEWPLRRLARVRTRVLLARTRGHEVIWLNSAASGPALRGLPRARGQRVVTAVHELDRVIDSLAMHDWQEVVARTDVFVAGSAGIAAGLVRRPGVDPGRVVVAPEFIDLRRELDGRPRAVAPDREAARKAFGVPGRGFVVGACASASWRKGADLFVQLGEALRRRGLFDDRGSVWLVWVGAPPQTEFVERLRFDLAVAGLDERVRFVEPRRDLTATFAAFDAFVATSREDALPLAALEAGRARLPIVAFESTGLGDVYRSGESVIVPFGDVEAMAETIRRWVDDRPTAHGLGIGAERRVAEEFDVGSGAPRWWAVVESMLT